ncbi:MAG: 1-acyl-sn-glycerol-3-phosphate acyltransferase [Myxococcota bacterium]
MPSLFAWPGWALYLALFGLLVLWLRMRLARRRAKGQLTEAERRFDATLQRFRVEIDRFKFTRQAAVKILLNHDHAILTEVEELASSGERERTTLRVQVNRYVEEIVPFFKPLAYYSFGYKIARLLLNTLYQLDFRPDEVARIKAYSKERPRSVVYLMNHRSNADYVLAAYVLAEKIALSFAVGEWARVWPLEYLFKAFGSFFLRRGFRDPLYHTVLRRYVQLMTKNAVTQAIFPEGGLTRDGRLRAPKIGLVDAIVCAKEDRGFARELIFVPVAINYDRVLEDRALVVEAGTRRPPVSRLRMAMRVSEILFSNVRKFARHKIRKNGMAAVRFGEPVSFDAWHAAQGVDIFSLAKDERRAHVARFCNEMHRRIAALVPATPLCIVAKVLLARPRGTRAELRADVAREILHLETRGVDIVRRTDGAAWMLDGALLRFGLRRLVTEAGDLVEVAADAKALLAYYANAIAHHDDGIVPEVERPRHLEAAAR